MVGVLDYLSSRVFSQNVLFPCTSLCVYFVFGTKMKLERVASCSTDELLSSTKVVAAYSVIFVSVAARHAILTELCLLELQKLLEL